MPRLHCEQRGIITVSGISSFSLHSQLGRSSTVPSYGELVDLVRFVLRPERKWYVLAVIYGVAISILTLAVPVSVQMLISSVANTGVPQAVLVLALLLFAVLAVSGILLMLRYYLMDRLKRRLYARLTTWMASELLRENKRELSPDDESLLTDRYFDIMTLKTHIPELLVGGVTVLLQTAAGALLVSFYHPLLMLFSAALLLSIYLIWRIWGPRAVRSSVTLSHAKYAVSSWLHRLTRSNLRETRATEGAADLARISDAHIEEFLSAHRVHFRHHFSQVVAFAVLYALANALLLGLGGYLVILGELTLGQLVAAELILSVVLVNMSQFSVYLDKVYDIFAAAEEVSLFECLAEESR